MSKSSRARKKAKRTADKQRKRASNRAQYAAWRDQGINQKSQRAKKNKAKNAKAKNTRKRVRSKPMSTVRAKVPSGFLTQKQARNQMSWKQFKKLAG